MEVNAVGKQDSFSNYRQHYPDGRKSHHTWGYRLETLARVIPDRIAFIQGERQLTWREFNARVNRLGNALLGLGVQKEERIAIMGFNTIEWMESYFAISRIGAVPVNVNPRYVAAELKHIFLDSDAALVIVEPASLGRVQEIRAELPLLRQVIVIGREAPAGDLAYEALLDKASPAPPRLSWTVTNEDFAFLFYTGGTTGYPKGTVWDYESRVRGLDYLVINAMKPMVERLVDLPSESYAALSDTFPFPLYENILKSDFVRRLAKRESGPVGKWVQRQLDKLPATTLMYRLAGGKMKLLIAAPLFHGAAYESSFSQLGTNACTTLFLTTPHPFNPAELWETVERRQVNMILIVGDAFAIPMVEELDRKKYRARSVAIIVSSGVTWSAAIKKRLFKHIPGLLTFDSLGTTETSSAFTHLSTSDQKEIPSLRVKLVKEGVNQTRCVNPETGQDVKPGEVGELIYGGYTALGYWKDQEMTARCWRVLEGKRWFFVGDQGTADEEGYFIFRGRGALVINSGGEKVYPEEVEDVLRTHPSIRDCAVVGVPDSRWGEAVAVLVESKPGRKLSAEEVIEFCRGKMAGFKKPKHVVLVDELPRTATGKLARPGLKQMARERLGIS